MKSGTKIEKWIDLNMLPRDSYGRIRWKYSIGCKINFKYGDISGVIEILNYNSITNKVSIFIDTFTDINGFNICPDQLKTCSIGNALKKPIAITNPDLVKYLADKDDANKYSSNSGKYVETKCPNCGTIKIYRIQDLCRRGFSCPACSDGISWPNKFMYHILKQSGVFFINEVTHKHKGFEWVGKYKYDFYLEKDDDGYIVEMDGNFHFGDYFYTYEQAQLADIEKDKLAIEHGIKVIRVNCNYSDLAFRFDFIKNNIINSEISQIIDLSLINWENANRSALRSNIITVAQLWDNGLHNKKQIASDVGISVDTVEKYLRISERLHLSTYNKEQDKKDGISRTAKALSRPLVLLKNNEIINVFQSTKDLERKSMTLYGIQMHSQSIGAACRGIRLHAYGYTMRYITHEEYERLLPQFQTVQN